GKQSVCHITRPGWPRGFHNRWPHSVEGSPPHWGEMPPFVANPPSLLSLGRGMHSPSPVLLPLCRQARAGSACAPPSRTATDRSYIVPPKSSDPRHHAAVL